MSVRKSFKTKAGTELPLVTLKGREYLMVAHRLVWLVEEVHSYQIDTDFLQLEPTAAIARTKIVLFDQQGKMIKSATATKRETQQDFPDFIEKSETGSMGRALAMLGFGTQFAESDLDEGQRLADAPLRSPSLPVGSTQEETFLLANTAKVASFLNKSSQRIASLNPPESPQEDPSVKTMPPQTKEKKKKTSKSVEKTHPPAPSTLNDASFTPHPTSVWSDDGWD